MKHVKKLLQIKIQKSSFVFFHFLNDYQNPALSHAWILPQFL